MLLVFASSLRINDEQTGLLLDALRKTGKEYCLVNPLKIDDLHKLALEVTSGRINVYYNGVNINPISIFYSRLWRTDCLRDIDQTYRYPTILRQ